MGEGKIRGEVEEEGRMEYEVNRKVRCIFGGVQGVDGGGELEEGMGFV